MDGTLGVEDVSATVGCLEIGVISEVEDTSEMADTMEVIDGSEVRDAWGPGAPMITRNHWGYLPEPSIPGALPQARKLHLRTQFTLSSRPRHMLGTHGHIIYPLGDNYGKGGRMGRVNSFTYRTLTDDISPAAFTEYPNPTAATQIRLERCVEDDR
jgi:hypothetical protein